MRMLLFYLTLILLTACSSPPHNQKISDATRQHKHESNCAIRIFQNDQEILPVALNGASTYKLLPSEFKIDVRPISCNPSMALQNKHEISYITQTPLVFSGGGHWAAGAVEDIDILTSASIGGNPRTTIDEEIESSTNEVQWAKSQYQELCKNLGYCPTPVKHYSTAWPFFDPATIKYRGFALFKRFDQFSPMQRASGRVINAVIYTEWKTISKGEKWNKVQMYILEPHVIRLDFKN